jgi:hypothetical protein
LNKKGPDEINIINTTKSSRIFTTPALYLCNKDGRETETETKGKIKSCFWLSGERSVYVHKVRKERSQSGGKRDIRELGFVFSKGCVGFIAK